MNNGTSAISEDSFVFVRSDPAGVLDLELASIDFSPAASVPLNFGPEEGVWILTCRPTFNEVLCSNVWWLSRAKTWLEPHTCFLAPLGATFKEVLARAQASTRHLPQHLRYQPTLKTFQNAEPSPLFRHKGCVSAVRSSRRDIPRRALELRGRKFTVSQGEQLMFRPDHSLYWVTDADLLPMDSGYPVAVFMAITGAPINELLWIVKNSVRANLSTPAPLKPHLRNYPLPRLGQMSQGIAALMGRINNAMPMWMQIL
ncbi:hypothetical protein SAMN04489740_4166 [Arthrobacter alpinus]|uniref:Uncharacterized protein n=2 Tax=Arthrobacter alpinus TaxID=656366 RepID=A0A1H5PDI3_9MICC|nr:hypothetical protein SAMN04489740_4166 [Arthrobacter alpinus]